MEKKYFAQLVTQTIAQVLSLKTTTKPQYTVVLPRSVFYILKKWILKSQYLIKLITSPVSTGQY
jgi:hypothetical protein